MFVLYLWDKSLWEAEETEKYQTAEKMKRKSLLNLVKETFEPVCV